MITSRQNAPGRLQKTRQVSQRKVKNAIRSKSSLPTTISEADLIRQRVSDTSESDSDSSGSGCDAESDVEPGIPLKDIKSAGRTITRCCDMFCDVNKAVHLVMLSKQEEQEDLSESNDEDGRRARKEVLDRM